MSKTVTLRNGAEVMLSMVAILWRTINRLLDTDPVVLYEAVCLARDRKHTLFGVARTRLQEICWTDSTGKMHDDIRNVLLSSAQGESIIDMTFRQPVKKGVDDELEKK